MVGVRLAFQHNFYAVYNIVVVIVWIFASSAAAIYICTSACTQTAACGPAVSDSDSPATVIAGYRHT